MYQNFYVTRYKLPCIGPKRVRGSKVRRGEILSFCRICNMVGSTAIARGGILLSGMCTAKKKCNALIVMTT